MSKQNKDIFRELFDAGFSTCRGMADNHPHYEGEQADRIYRKALAEVLRPTGADNVDALLAVLRSVASVTDGITDERWRKHSRLFALLSSAVIEVATQLNISMEGDDGLAEAAFEDAYNGIRASLLGESAAPDLLAACKAALEASAAEWLYQTGQTVRPEQNYPPQGSICGELADVGNVLRAAIAKAEAP